MRDAGIICTRIPGLPLTLVSIRATNTRHKSAGLAREEESSVIDDISISRARDASPIIARVP